jgi:signal transduction histidine kinase
MLLPVGPEFVALCRAQVALLTQGVGASLSVVYLTQQMAEGAETELVSVVAHPESAADWVSQNGLPLRLMDQDLRQPKRRLLGSGPSTPARESAPKINRTLRGHDRDYLTEGVDPPIDASAYREATAPGGTAQYQLVLPLMHEQVVLGLLVAGRDDRDWIPWEQSQIEQIANTIAMACVLDQRYQWLEQTQQQQRLLRAQQHNATDNLLHQFRNSITALQTFGKLVLKRLLPGDANHNIAASIVRETERLQELAQELAAISQVDVAVAEPFALPPGVSSPATLGPLGSQAQDVITISALPVTGFQPPMVLGAVHVAAVLEPLLASAQAIAQDRTLTLHAEIADPLATVWANPQALREVLNNLIENALKYTPAGGQVWVQGRQLPVLAVDEEDAWVEIAISDTGPGIPPEDLAHLFERHYRGVQAQTDIPGTGLGLAIAKALIDQMHGEIDVISPGRAGRGTTFVVRLEVWQA